MNLNDKNGTIIIELEGRIDTNSAPEWEKDIMGVFDSNEGKQVSFDANKLQYISSSGLRVLMKACKKTKDKITVTNVSPEIFDIFETTGFTELFKIEKKLREISVEGCEKLGEGGNGAVYRLDDDKIVKVYKPWMELSEIDRERSFARTAFINGIPSVIAYDTVQVGDCLGVVFEMLKSDTLGHAMRDNPDKLEEYVDQYVALAKTLHNTHVAEGSFTRIQEVFHGLVDNLGDWCSQEEMDILRSIVDSIPEADTVTHNDLHPGNIMIQDGELVLIDMPEVTMGPPICDMVAIYRDMISAPKSNSAIMEQSAGMPCDMIMKAGNLFFQKYTGITDPAELEAYYKKLGLLYAFNVSLMPGTKSARAVKMGDQIMNNLLRPVVIPNEQTIKALFMSM